MTNSRGVGGVLREARKRLGLSQEAVAAHINLHRHTLRKIERGDVSPSVAQLEELCQLYELDVQVVGLVSDDATLLAADQQIDLLFALYEAGQTDRVLRYRHHLVAEVERLRRTSSAQLPRLAKLLQLLTILLKDSGDANDALIYAQQSVQVCAQLRGLGHPAAIDLSVSALYRRSRLLQDRGRMDAANDDAQAIAPLLMRCTPLVRGVGAIHVARMAAAQQEPLGTIQALFQDAIHIGMRHAGADELTGFSINVPGVRHAEVEAALAYHWAGGVAPAGSDLHLDTALHTVSNAIATFRGPENRWPLAMRVTQLDIANALGEQDEVLHGAIEVAPILRARQLGGLQHKLAVIVRRLRPSSRRDTLLKQLRAEDRAA